MAGTPTGGTVTVACKHEPGIWMRIFKDQEYDVPVLGGGTRKERHGVPVGEPIRIFGPATPFGQAPKCLIVGGYALTPNVPADIAKTWMEQNKQSDMVKNQVIFIMDKPEDAKAKAKEHASVKSGIQPLDVGVTHKNGREMPRDPRWPKSRNPNMSDVISDSNKDREFV